MSRVVRHQPPPAVHIVIVASSFPASHTTVPGARCRCQPVEAIELGRPQQRYIVHGDGPAGFDADAVPAFVRLTEGEA